MLVFVRPSDPVLAQRILNERFTSETGSGEQATPEPVVATGGDDVRDLVSRLQALAASEGLSPEQRQQAALRAKQAAVQYAAEPPSAAIAAAVEPLIVDSLAEDTLATGAVAALARRGTRVSQIALVELASRGDAPAETRRNAALAFRTSVQEFGLALCAKRFSANTSV